MRVLYIFSLPLPLPLVINNNLECGRNTRKESDSYFLLVRKLDMEIPPDSLGTVGVNGLSANSNTKFISII
jgi:hypothetical protein